MLTVSDIVSDPSLHLLSGSASSVSRPIRWVHVSEHEDPGPWISGGELVLTTGYNLHDESKQHQFMRRLAENEVTGLGFGVGFDHEEVPLAMVDASAEFDIPLIRVSYDLPFIEIIESASEKLMDERHEALRRVQQIQLQLERELIGGAGLDRIVRILSIETQGSAVVFDHSGTPSTSTGNRGIDPAGLGPELAARAEQGRISPFSPGCLEGSGLAFPIPGTLVGSGSSWLVFKSRHGGSPGRFETLLAKACATLCGLHRMKADAVLRTERRLATTLMANAVDRAVDPQETASRLRSIGLGNDVAVMVFETADHTAARDALESATIERSLPAIVSIYEATAGEFVCIVLGRPAGSPGAEASALLDELRTIDPAARVAVSDFHAGTELPRAFHQARCGLQATSSRKERPAVSTPADLGALSLLLAMNDDEALRVFSDSVLDPIGPADDPFTQELLLSLETFIDCNGNWEKASRELYCHRHTLRHRMNRIEERTHRDLGNAADRIECWLALKARHIAAPSTKASR